MNLALGLLIVVAKVATSDGPDEPVDPHADPPEDRARSLLARIRREPARMPEEPAVFAVKQMRPRADASVEGLRQRLPDADAELPREQTITRGIRRSVTEGAFVGGPFLVWIPVAFRRALLSEAQLMLELGCPGGFPLCPRRLLTPRSGAPGPGRRSGTAGQAMLSGLSA